MKARHEIAQQAFDSVRRGSEPVVGMMENAAPGGVPALNYRTGGYRLEEAYRPHEWATFQWDGFLAGRLWLLADHFGDDRIRAAAATLATTMAEPLGQRPPEFSAAGCDNFYALCLGARLTGDERLTKAALQAVRQYAENFDERLGLFFQVPGINRAVVDTGMNLLPFYWAECYEPGWAEVAVRHNRNVLRYGAVRPDGSTYQAIEFDLDTASPHRRYTMQGYSDETTWARGQSWVMHNYVNAFEVTGDEEFLDVARHSGRWYVENLPADHVPFYDFADPAAPGVPRDSCSAAISANALFKLAHLDTDSAGWAREAGETIIDELLENYLSPGGVLLHSSWGRLPPEKAGAGLSRFPLEDVMPYGNYWVVEALYRRLHEDWSLLTLARPGADQQQLDHVAAIDRTQPVDTDARSAR